MSAAAFRRAQAFPRLRFLRSKIRPRRCRKALERGRALDVWKLPFLLATAWLELAVVAAEIQSVHLRNPAWGVVRGRRDRATTLARTRARPSCGLSSRPARWLSAIGAEVGMPKETKRQRRDNGDAAIPSNDATVVAKVVDAIKRAMRAPHESESNTKAIGLEEESASQKTNPRTVAYHEAGHAVIARNFGLTVMRVSTNPADGELFAGQPREGYTQLERNAERHASAQRRLWIALAGPAAQEHLYSGDHRTEDLICARADYEYARKLYAELRGNPDCKAKDLVSDERRARALVTKHWSAIEAVALALLEHPRHTLSGKELDALLLAQQRS